jgi:hypothetical protein
MSLILMALHELSESTAGEEHHELAGAGSSER